MLHTKRRPRWGVRLSRQELALIAVTAVWGTTFLVVHLAVQHGGPLFFVGLRFLAAGAISAVIFRRTLSGLKRRELGADRYVPEGCQRQCISSAMRAAGCD